MTEGNSGTALLNFTVTLEPAADMATGVSWATSKETADTATPGTDYTAGSGTLSFAKGDTSKTVTVTVTGDELDEADETLTVTLSSATGGAEIGTATATGTITDDDDRGSGVHADLGDGHRGGRRHPDGDLHRGKLASAAHRRRVRRGGDGRRDGGDGASRDGELHDVELEDGQDGDGHGGGRRSSTTRRTAPPRSGTRRAVATTAR